MAFQLTINQQEFDVELARVQRRYNVHLGSTNYDRECEIAESWIEIRKLREYIAVLENAEEVLS